MKPKVPFIALTSLLVLVALFLAGSVVPDVRAAQPSELFFSEYIEGSGYDKAVEIYNGTGSAVDLGVYTLELYSNGSASVSKSMSLPGTVTDGDVYVVAHRDAVAAITDEADVIDGPNNVINWNGDDTVVLRKNGAVVDVIGQVGFDPGSEWGSGLVSTKDNTIRRKDSVCAGDSDETDVFDPSTEWVGFAPNTFDGFGAHTVNCGGGEPSTDIIINEVDADTPGNDAEEFIELYDGGIGNSPLDGLVVVLFNGSDDKSYSPPDAFDLDGYTTDANGYFVIGTVADSDIYVPPTTYGWLQNGADAVALFIGDGTDFPNDTGLETNNLIDAIVYDTNDSDDSGLLVLLNPGQPQVNEGGGGDKDIHSNQRCPNGSGGALNTASYEQFAPTPGDVNSCVTPVTIAKIHEVQGSGLVSPMVGDTVVVEGIVVGDFQEYGQLGGFHVQEEDADIDTDTATSEGIFVYHYSTDVSVGDLVQVSGRVVEHYGLTEITSVSEVSVISNDNLLPVAAVVTLPVASLDVWETVEGMHITIPHTLYASGNYTQGQYGEVDLSVGAPLDNPTNVVAPGAAAIALQKINDLSRIQMDDGSTVQNPLPLPPYLGLENTLRTGDTIPGLTGVLSYGFGAYEVHPTQPVIFTRDNARPATPDVGGSLKVAAYNVLNYFTTLDDSGPICGPLGNQGCRGADTADEFGRQRAKLVDAISQLDADIVGLMEIENYAGDVPTADLVAGLNDAVGADTYAYIATGAVGSDAIRQAILFKPATVTPVGDFVILDSSVDPDFDDTKNRPVLAQTFQENGTDDVVTVAVNHLKSKGSACVGDPDTGDGQGNCNLTRTAAAKALVDWLATDPTGAGNGQYLITGDLNAYAMENPVTTIEAAGYTDLIEENVGSGWAAGAYSYNFYSQSGYLDHGLSSLALLPRVTGASFWHVNADEPSALNYNDYNQPDLFYPHEFRSSDHDPVVVGICETTAPVVTATASPDTLWPANHKYVDVTVDVDVTDADPNATITLLSVTSNEPDNGSGDGNTVNDIVIVDDFNFQLRAERSGNGDGRIYTITYEVTDDCGNSTIATAEVTVPKSQGKGKGVSKDRDKKK